MRKNKLFLSLIAVCSIVGMGITSCNSEPVQGPQGEQGPVGPQGPAGENGENGEDGSLILHGEGKPVDTLGKDTDVYIDSKTGDLYKKENGSWTLVMNIKGEDGQDGHDGSDGLNGSNGEDGKTAWSNTILPSDNGYVMTSVGSALVGEDVTFTFVPDSGYLLSSLLIFNNGEEVTLPEATVENSEVSYTLAMQEGGFVVSATFGEASATGETSYYKDGQKYEGGLVDGLGNIITEGTVVKDAVDFEGGSGTSEDPLLVESKEQFNEITNTGESYFKLSENADFTGENKVDALPSTSENLEELSLDLNGNTIEFVAQDPTTTVSPIKVASDTTLTYKNGKIEANQMRDGGLSLFALGGDYTNNNIVLDNMEVETNGTAIYTQSVGSDIVIRDSVIHAGDYGVGTNASKGSAETDQISITIENSTISTLHEGDLTANENLYTNTGLFINVSAEVVVRDSTIEGDRQAVIVRGGDVTLENTTLNYTGNDYYSTLPHCYDGEWLTGNGVPVAAVTLGNNEANAYSTTTKLTMSGVTVNELTSINDSNSEISLLADETPVTDPEKPYLLYANGESEENNVTIISDSSSYEQFKDSEGRVYINSLGDKVLLTIDDSLNTLKNNVFVDGQLYSSAYYDGDTFVKEKSVKVDGVKFNGGSGTEEDPLTIINEDQLQLISEVSKLKDLTQETKEYLTRESYNYRLDADLVLTKPVDWFTGRLDGNGHTISLADGYTASYIFNEAYGIIDFHNFNIDLTNGKLVYLLSSEYYDVATRWYYPTEITFKDINITGDNTLKVINTNNFGFLCPNSPQNKDYFATKEKVDILIDNVHITGFNVLNTGSCAGVFIGYTPYGNHMYTTIQNSSFTGNLTALNQVGYLYGNQAGVVNKTYWNDEYDGRFVVSNCELNGNLNSLSGGQYKVVSGLDNSLISCDDESVNQIQTNITNKNDLTDQSINVYYDGNGGFVTDSTVISSLNLGLTTNQINWAEGGFSNGIRTYLPVEYQEDVTSLTNVKDLKVSSLMRSDFDALNLGEVSLTTVGSVSGTLDVSYCVVGDTIYVVFTPREGNEGITITGGDSNNSKFVISEDETGNIAGYLNL